MKIIHTGDWHIGKIVNEFSMLEDQRFLLGKLVELLEEEKPDAFIIAGDIYDRSVPPAEAVGLLDDILSKIVLELNIPVLAISGNHDSAERLSFGSKLLRNKGLYISGLFNKNIERVTLKDEYGNVTTFPFCHLDIADSTSFRIIDNDGNVLNPCGSGYENEIIFAEDVYQGTTGHFAHTFFINENIDMSNITILFIPTMTKFNVTVNQ